MRLATRLTWFFLAAMAVVLLGFSIAVYASLADHLHRQVDERLASVLNTLAAAAEIGPEGIDWEPEGRNLSLGGPALGERFSWRVSDGWGRRLDGSTSGAVDRGLARLADGDGPARRQGRVTDESGSEWQIATHRHGPSSHEDGGTPPVDPPSNKHEAIVFGAAASLDEARASLRNLALSLAGISSAVWTVALVVGRRYCLVALRPLTEMADAARVIGVDDGVTRLPVWPTGDELEEMGRTVNALLDRLGESMDRQQRFAADAAHQLCTPLTSLQGQVELALRQERPPDEYRRVLGLFLSRTRHLRQIVDGLMFLSTADAEAMRPKLERLEIDAWLRCHLDLWSKERRAAVSYSAHGEADDEVFVQPPLLGELMNNLLDNAAKYGRPGSPIRVQLARGESEVSVSIADDGPGIDRQDLPRIFDPFFRAEAARIRGTVGNGLGLSIAARIAAVFGACISADSTPGRGATFTVTFPRKAPDDAGPAQAGG
jgi:signal transduction histidine kinase